MTPRECGRLMGFPDDWTAIDWRGRPAPDGRQYKALGNSMAVPVIRWVLDRLMMVDALVGEGRGSGVDMTAASPECPAIG